MALKTLRFLTSGSRTVRGTFCCFKPPSLWYLLCRAALGNKRTTGMQSPSSQCCSVAHITAGALCTPPTFADAKTILFQFRELGGGKEPVEKRDLEARASHGVGTWDRRLGSGSGPGGGVGFQQQEQGRESTG